MSTTIRVSEETHQRLAVIAESTGRPMTRVLDDAVEALERRVFFDGMDQRYRALRSDDPAWREVEAERTTEEGTLGDSSR